MTHTELADRHEEIGARLLAIDCALTESKRRYFAGLPGALTMVERTALEAEAALLRHDKFMMAAKMNAHRRSMLDARRLSAHRILVEMLTERGMADLVKESERRASEQQVKGAEL